MRTRVVWLMATLMIGLALSAPSQAQQVTNLIQNGGFETGTLTPWATYANSPAVLTSEVVTTCAGATVPENPIEGRNCLHLSLTTLGANNYAVGLQYRSMLFQKGKKYTLSAFLKCKTGTLGITFKPELAQDPWTGYGAAGLTMTNKWQEYYITTPVLTADVTPAEITFHIGYAVAEFWIDDVKWYEGDYVPTVVKTSGAATALSPKDGTTDVPADPVLSWNPGPFANTHNVYFGTAFDDVNKATVTSAALVSPGQTGATFSPASPLEFGKTYYWRIDEVNAPPSTTVFKGNVWKFTVEPYTYPITSVTATASSSDKTTTPPANTINGSGLTNDLHGTGSDTMWVSSMTGTTPAWIQYQFDKVYKLSELWVWNHNTEFESVLGYGIKDVTVEYSLDGTAWTLLKDMQFAQAQAAAGYAHNTTVDFGGVLARYVKITAKSNWSLVGLKQYGLSEVRFFYIPVQARAPQPATATSAVSVGAGLDWRPGRDATSQKVYLGTDRAAVTNGTAPVQTVTNHGFAPAALDFGTTYYWKVDEVGTATYPGEVWKFTTQEYAVVDDFESYNDTTNRIYDTWVDGLTDGKSGSQVGYDSAPFAETTLSHGGKQSMPLKYSNTTFSTSEAARTFDPVQDWTASGANSLALWFMGYPLALVDKGNNAFSVTSTGTDIWGNADQFRFVYKSLSGNGSITARVDSLTRADAWSKAGVMIRESLDAGSKHVMVVMTPDNGASLQYRTNTGGASANADTAGLKTPYWVRITRTSNAFKAEQSGDGKTWTQVGTDQTVSMVANVYVGLCVTSHSAGAYSTAEFSNVSTAGTGSWQNVSIGVTQQSNGVAPLYLTVEDKAGKKKTLVNADAAAVTKSTWTEWRVALSDLTGVNMAAVKKLTIGVGDPAGAKSGAAGTLYIDDILFGKPIVPVGLVARYTLENNVNDVSGNGHNGTVIGAPTYVTGAPGLGTGMLFPGTPGNAINLGTFDPSEKTGMLSVSLWAKWNGLSNQWQGLIGKRDTWAATETMWQIEAAQTTGVLSLGRYNISVGSGNQVLKVGEWTHLAVTFDKTTARFYVNGVQTGSGAFSFGPDTEASLQFGCDSADGNAFNGALDDIRLYDVVLTPAEILTLAGK